MGDEDSAGPRWAGEPAGVRRFTWWRARRVPLASQARGAAVSPGLELAARRSSATATWIALEPPSVPVAPRAKRQHPHHGIAVDTTALSGGRDGAYAEGRAVRYLGLQQPEMWLEVWQLDRNQRAEHPLDLGISGCR